MQMSGVRSSKKRIQLTETGCRHSSSIDLTIVSDKWLAEIDECI